MTNHVPDAALAAIDDLGEGLLVGEARPITTRLRSDLRLEVPCTEATIGAGETRATFVIDHGRRQETLRGYGSFVETIADAIDDRFRQWGIEPPTAYEFCGRENGWHRYGGTLRF